MTVIAYTDGSFNASTKTYGAGALLFLKPGEPPLQIKQSGNHPLLATAQNVAGETLAAALVMEVCKQIPNLDELIIYHDYMGISNWANGSWKAQKPVAKNYVTTVKSVPFKLTFRHVKGHSGDQYNEMADMLSRQACGLST